VLSGGAGTVTAGGGVTPYYADDLVTLFHGDCNEVLRSVGNESIDCILTDPPYGVSYLSGFRQESFLPIANDHAVPVAWVAELMRISRFRTSVYWFACDESLEETRRALLAAGFGLNTMLVWDKQATNAGNLADYATRTEFIVFATKGPTRLNGSRDPNLLSIPRINPKLMVHPTEKPIPLLQYLVVKSTDPDEVVLDPFAGSGSTLMAARSLGRRAVGIEIEERYCEIAARRLAQDVLDFGEAS
jgi:site-specific DNA-methyltransferase (adenine-specific)